MRHYAIGDIHGSIDHLKGLLEQVDLDSSKYENSRIVFLGDYIDRGPDVFGVIDLLSKRIDKDVFLCGNHDQEFRRAARSSLYFDYYNSCIDDATISSYKKNGYDSIAMDIPESHRYFFSRLLTFHDTEHSFFVHAGIDPLMDLYNQQEDTYLWIRAAFLNWHGPFPKTIVHGHSITKSGNVEFDGRKISVDTSAYKNDKLSCAVIEEGRLVDVIEQKGS